jgi:hypothetical protein
MAGTCEERFIEKSAELKISILFYALEEVSCIFATQFMIARSVL